MKFQTESFRDDYVRFDRCTNIVIFTKTCKGRSDEDRPQLYFWNDELETKQSTECNEWGLLEKVRRNWRQKWCLKMSWEIYDPLFCFTRMYFFEKCAIFMISYLVFRTGDNALDDDVFSAFPSGHDVGLPGALGLWRLSYWGNSTSSLALWSIDPPFARGGPHLQQQSVHGAAAPRSTPTRHSASSVGSLSALMSSVLTTVHWSPQHPRRPDQLHRVRPVFVVDNVESLKMSRCHQFRLWMWWRR